MAMKVLNGVFARAHTMVVTQSKLNPKCWWLLEGLIYDEDLLGDKYLPIENLGHGPDPQLQSWSQRAHL